MTATSKSAESAKNLFRKLSDFEERDASWLVPEYLPSGALTTIAGDGGCGKTSVWVDLAAAVSTGRRCFFDPTPEGFSAGEPSKVVFLSAEDSIEIVLKKRLKAAGANLSNILTASLQDERFKELKFDSPLLKQMIENVKPALVIFDPLQGFIPEGVNMGSRSDMRGLLSPLIGIGESTGTAFVLIVHTNKRSGVYGRNRIADSADIWDYSRSVLIVGKTPDGTRYLSHEKSNYCEAGQTILFDIDEGLPVFRDYSTLHDCDFVRQSDYECREAPQRTEAETFIFEYLQHGKQPTAELDEAAKARGISKSSLSRAKAKMSKDRVIGYKAEGFGTSKQWFTYLIEKRFTP